MLEIVDKAYKSCIPVMNHLPQRQRAFDISESYFLLLELCCTEPIVQQCFGIVENICLSHGLSIKGKTPTKNFQQHVDEHFIPFLKMSIRAMHMYGFVPWRLKRLASGDKIPEVLPPGTFRWTVEMPNDSNTKTDRDAILVYAVYMNNGCRQVEDIHVTSWVPPNNICENSIMYATVPSPMAGIIESYKYLVAASKRQAHADAWNCTARVVVTHDPKDHSHDQHRRELFGTFHQHIDEYGRLNPFKPTNPSDKLDDIFYTRSLNHHPAIYTLPANHHIDQAPELKPCADLGLLQAKYKVDVCSLMGIPPELVTTVQYNSGEKQAKTSQTSTGTSRIFQAKMQFITKFLIFLLGKVYQEIYGADTGVSFELIPMPRLEISSIADLKILHEIGVIQPEHSIDLANILLGNLKNQKSP